jgi:hypothetical protein
MLDLLPFKYVVAVDTEFHFGGHATPAEASRSGERPRPVCLVAKELHSGKIWRLCCGEFGAQPPFLMVTILIVAHYASAELGVFRALAGRSPNSLSTLLPNSAPAPMACTLVPA